MSALSTLFSGLVWLGAGLLAAAVCLWWRRRRTSIPGPPGLPLLGNALSFYQLPVLWGRLREMHARYGDLFRLYVGPKLVIVLTQPEDIQSVLLGSKPRVREPLAEYVLRSYLGDGLFGTNGETWKRHRRNIEPAFHTEELEKFMEKFNDAGRFLCDRLAERKGEEVDVYHLLISTTFRSAAETIFNLKLDSVVPGRQQQDELLDVFVDAAKALSTILYRPWTAIKLIRWMTAEGRTLTRFHTVAKDLIERGLDVATKNLSGLKPSDRTVATLLLKEKNSGEILSNKEIRDETLTIGSASIETLSTSQGYIFTLLGLYPEWQDLAQRELDDHFGTGGDYFRAVTTADLAQLKVIDAIVKETGRLFTTVPAMAYLVGEETPLAGGRHAAPRGSTVLLAYYLMHRHPSLFPHPDRFDPGRFLDGGSATTRKPYSYLPFGIGARKCIGARYAVLQMKVVLATVLRRYRILPGTSREQLEESVIGITAHPVTGFRVTCIPRDNVSS